MFWVHQKSGQLGWSAVVIFQWQMWQTMLELTFKSIVLDVLKDLGSKASTVLFL